MIHFLTHKNKIILIDNWVFKVLQDIIRILKMILIIFKNYSNRNNEAYSAGN